MLTSRFSRTEPPPPKPDGRILWLLKRMEGQLNLSDEQQEQVVGQRHDQHRDTEEAQPEEEAVVVPVALHVTRAEQEDERRDERDDEQERAGDAVDHQAELELDAPGHLEPREGRAEGAAVRQRHPIDRGHDRERERAEHREDDQPVALARKVLA